MSVSDRYWRSLLEIKRVDTEETDPVVSAWIGGWSEHESDYGQFHLSIVPPNIRSHMKPGAYLYAMVTIGVEDSRDLRFKDFELAPDPPTDKEFESWLVQEG